MNTKSAMTSRERILAAGRGLPVDRLPVFYWLNPHACCRMIAEYQPLGKWGVNALASFLWRRFHNGGELKSHEYWRALPLLLDGYPFNALTEYTFQLGSDMVFIGHNLLQSVRLKKGHLIITDVYGVVRSLGSGIYVDMIEPAIKDISELQKYVFPDFTAESGYELIRMNRRRHPDKCLCAGIFGAFDFPQTGLFGTEKMLTMLMDYPEEMQTFMQRWTENEIVALRHSVKAGADIVLIYDDYGYNTRTFMSPRMWKKFVFPHLKRLVDTAHEAGALTLLHSCGYQMTLLDSYIEAGIDMLQAFQPLAGNDFTAAYAKYGDKLTFVTGIDTQRGETMNLQEFQDDIVNAYKIGCTKPRFVLGFTHEMQYTMPDANVRVLFDTVAGLQAGTCEI